jgi:hypothetical protein
MGPFARNGLSLARNGFRFHGFHSGVNGPGLLLRSLVNRIRARSVFRLRRPDWLAPIFAVSLRRTRCASNRLTHATASPCLHSPLGVFRSLGIKAFNRRCCRPVRLLNSPDLRSLPAAPSIASLGLGSLFAVRYVSSGLLFLKPLGTNLNMRLFAAPVNPRVIVTIPFQQLI